MTERLRDRLRRMFSGARLTVTEAASPAANQSLADAAAYCPLPGCNTCPPVASFDMAAELELVPLDVVAEQERCLDLTYTTAWLVEQWPDAWYYENPRKLRGFARGILELRGRVDAGRMAP